MSFECEWKTYDEWQEMGYQVQRGEKSTQRDAWGTPLFSEDQVYNPITADAEDYDDYEFLNDFSLTQDGPF